MAAPWAWGEDWGKSHPWSVYSAQAHVPSCGRLCKPISPSLRTKHLNYLFSKFFIYKTSSQNKILGGIPAQWVTEEGHYFGWGKRAPEPHPSSPSLQWTPLCFWWIEGQNQKATLQKCLVMTLLALKHPQLSLLVDKGLGWNGKQHKVQKSLLNDFQDFLS